MSAHVVVVGGSYAGLSVARALDPHVRVTVVEPRDGFIHVIGMLRAVVDADFAPRVLMSYDGALHAGRFLRDRVVRLGERSVVLENGGELAADAVVLATGSTYPFPAKPESAESAETLRGLDAVREALAAARRIVLLGAGPVGLELAGEILGAWPDSEVTIVDPSPVLLSGPYPDALRASLIRQLDELGAEIILGASLAAVPATPPNILARTTLETDSGGELKADVWLRCYGGGVEPPVSSMTGVTERSGHVLVGPDLAVPGRPWLFAVGDVSNVPEPKRAGVARGHAEVVAANILALLGGGDTMQYAVPPPRILVPLGAAGGAGVHEGRLIPSAEVAAAKGADLSVSRTAAMYGLEAT